MICKIGHFGLAEKMESTVRRMKRTAGVNSLIWSFAVLILVRGVAAIDFTRNEDSLGNLDIYEVYDICSHNLSYTNHYSRLQGNLFEKGK